MERIAEVMIEALNASKSKLSSANHAEGWAAQPNDQSDRPSGWISAQSGRPMAGSIGKDGLCGTGLIQITVAVEEPAEGEPSP